MAKVTNIADKSNPFLEAANEEGSPFVLTPKSKRLLCDFNKKIANINRKDIKYQDKLDAIIELNTRVIPLIFQQLLSPAPNVDISVIASRTSIALRDISALIIKKREAEVNDDINFNSPKFQMIFGWFLELFSITLHEHKINEVEISNIFNSLAAELVGWEERIQKNLKGLSSKALSKTRNPFIEEFKAKLKSAKEIKV